MLNISMPLAHLEAYFTLDGKNYKIEKFKIDFEQPVDHKGQPEHEVRGGQLFITLSHLADDNLYLWGNKSNLLKNGEVVFQTDLGVTVLRMSITNAYCINLTSSVSAVTGTNVSMIIAPEKVSLNGIVHNNFWSK